MPALTREEYREKFGKMSMAQVRQIIIDKDYHEKHREWADEWLKDKERAEQTQRLERQEGSQEGALTISRQANVLAKTANTHADDANKLAKRSLYIAFGSMAVAILAFLVALVALFVD